MTWALQQSELLFDAKMSFFYAVSLLLEMCYLGSSAIFFLALHMPLRYAHMTPTHSVQINNLPLIRIVQDGNCPILTKLVSVVCKNLELFDLSIHRTKSVPKLAKTEGV